MREEAIAQVVSATHNWTTQVDRCCAGGAAAADDDESRHNKTRTLNKQKMRFNEEKFMPTTMRYEHQK